MSEIYASFGYYSKFKEHWNKDIFDLLDVVIKKYYSTNNPEPDAIIVANMLSQINDSQSQLGSIISSRYFSGIPAFRVEAACASGSVAINLATKLISSTGYSNILVIGVEKMTDKSTEETTLGLQTAGYSYTSAIHNISFPSHYAVYANHFLKNSLISKDTLFNISRKNHLHATSNPRAQFRHELTKSTYDSSPMVSNPLNLFDCSPITDGAAIALISSSNKKGLKLKSISQKSGDISPEHSTSFTSIKAAKVAAKESFRNAKIKPKDLSLVEVHDCFTIAEVIAALDLGLTELADLDKFFASKEADIINPSGGLKACGHPVAATGVKQVVSLLENLNQKEIGLAHNVGGTGQTAVVSIWEKL